MAFLDYDGLEYYNEKIMDKFSDITGLATRNLFDPSWLLTDGVTESSGVYSGTVRKVATGHAISAGNSPFPLPPFKANTQYTISFDTYTTGESANSKGVNFYVRYTDDVTEILASTYNNDSQWTHRFGTTAAGKTVARITTDWANKPDNIVYLKNVIFNVGEAINYMPYEIGAIDRGLRKNVLFATGDSTDRSSDILSVLTMYGSCILDGGEFYAHDIQMPDDSVIVGRGNSSKLIYNGSNSSGFVLKLGYRCTVENLLIEQSKTEYEPSDTSVGNVHGIVLEGDADASTPTFTPKQSRVHGCLIRWFVGAGIYCYDTGYSYKASLEVSDCSIDGCGAGIDIAYFSEYNQFTNVKCNLCGIGVVNNGGNNNFVNCCFSGNILGVLMDDTSGTMTNNSHGGMIGCSINHSGSNNGVAISLIGQDSGFIFTGCQVFFGKINITDSKGIVFGDLNAGSVGEINISGGGTIIIHDATFNTAPTINITNNTNVHLRDCYTRNGTAITI